MQSKAATPAEYLAELPDDRRRALSKIRSVVRKHLVAPSKGAIKEGIQYGMLGYFVPHKVYPHGYHCDPKQPLPVASLANQKNHMSIYLMCCYGDPAEEAWFRAAWTADGRGLDMGKACVRFRTLEDVPLGVVAELFDRFDAGSFIERYEAGLPESVKKKRAAVRP